MKDMSFTVVCSHFNPAGYAAPRRNLLRFLRQLRSQGIHVCVAELAYDDDPFFVPDRYDVLRFRTSRENVLWHKENLLNLAVERLHPDTQMVAWLDPDIWFERTDWHTAAAEALEKHAVVQLFEYAVKTGRDGTQFNPRRSSAAIGGTRGALDGAPGFAWAARRDLWSKAGGLVEKAFVGGGDRVMAAAWLGSEVLPEGAHYPVETWRNWTSESRQWVRQHGGCSFIPGTIFHEWHGDGEDRQYRSRYEVLQGVDPDGLVARGISGLLEFRPEVPKEMRDRLRAYFQFRNEDGAVPVGPQQSVSFASPQT